MLEFAFEILFEFIVEGSLEIGTSKKVPMLVRIIALLGFVVVYGGFIGLLLIYGLQALRADLIAAGCLFIFVSVGLVAVCVYLFAKKFRENGKGR